jgi:molybdate transport system regulatory protein
MLGQDGASADGGRNRAGGQEERTVNDLPGAQRPAMRIAYRIWLEADGRAFGEGPATLLELVRTEGSLSKASRRLGMSYNKAWRIVHAAEERLGFPLLDRTIGGRQGGGSILSAQGEELLERYLALRAAAQRELERLFDEHFANWPR